jgi:TerC family integral membrane protein
MTTTPVGIWFLFGVGILALLAIDLFVLHRKPHEVKLREALIASGVWIAISLLFNLWVYLTRGPVAGLDFLTAYFVEKSLSIDNIFLFIVIFRVFQIKPEAQHRVLYYGVLGALVLRAVFVFGGVALLSRFHFFEYVFGGFLVLVGAKMMFEKAASEESKPNFAVRMARKWLPVATEVPGTQLLVRRSGKWLATPLLLALIAVELSDILFAVDSVPAVLAITRDPFIAYSSNVFAILGLRSLYFALARILPRFQFIHQGLAVVLVFVGLKMLLAEKFAIPNGISLAVICGILAVAATASRVVAPKKSSAD